jgi:hypothetical protein
MCCSTTLRLGLHNSNSMQHLLNTALTKHSTENAKISSTEASLSLHPKSPTPSHSGLQCCHTYEHCKRFPGRAALATKNHSQHAANHSTQRSHHPAQAYLPFPPGAPVCCWWCIICRRHLPQRRLLLLEKSYTKNTVIACSTRLLTRIEDGKIVNCNTDTCTAIDKGRSLLTDLDCRPGY